MIRFALTALALLLAAPALAQDANPPVHVGPWLVGPMDSENCQAETHFGDHILLNISEDATGNGHVIFADDRWILKEGDSKPATWSWDGWKTSREGTFNVVKGGDGRFFLVMETGNGFTDEMAGATGLWLRVPGVGFDDDFAIPEAKDITLAIVVCNGKH